MYKARTRTNARASGHRRRGKQARWQAPHSRTHPPGPCTHEKHKKGSHKVPKDTNRGGTADGSRSGAKEGVDGRHLEHSANCKRPKQGLPQLRPTLQAGGWVAGPMQPTHRAHSRSR